MIFFQLRFFRYCPKSNHKNNYFLGWAKRKHKSKRSIVKNLKKRKTRNTLRMQERDKRGITYLWINRDDVLCLVPEPVFLKITESREGCKLQDGVFTNVLSLYRKWKKAKSLKK